MTDASGWRPGGTDDETGANGARPGEAGQGDGRAGEPEYESGGGAGLGARILELLRGVSGSVRRDEDLRRKQDQYARRR